MVGKDDSMTFLMLHKLTHLQNEMCFYRYGPDFKVLKPQTWEFSLRNLGLK